MRHPEEKREYSPWINRVSIATFDRYGETVLHYDCSDLLAWWTAGVSASAAAVALGYLDAQSN